MEAFRDILSKDKEVNRSSQCTFENFNTSYQILVVQGSRFMLLT